MSRIAFRVADTSEEFEQIFRLNHATFAVEIPQHLPHPEGRLIDRFHPDNAYVVGVYAGEVVAMVAYCSRRPFSLDQKLPDLDHYLRQPSHPCELRLLAIKPAWRIPGVLSGLLRALIRELLLRDFDLALISGTLREQRLYLRLGFQPFAQPVGTNKAMFQPMQLALERAREKKPGLFGGERLDTP
jgi:ribosomal protein S18 acetylase RimI-like enzyme